MSEAQTASQAVTPPAAITARQGAEMLAARRAQASTPESNPVSEAARTMGKAAAEARAQARQAQTVEQPQNASGEEQAGDGNNLLSGASDDEAATTEASADETQAQADPGPLTLADDQIVDLGEGVTLNGKELRDSILMRADYTRKTQDLSKNVGAFNEQSSQLLSQLGQVLEAVTTKVLGEPKRLSEFMRLADGDAVRAQELFEEQNARFEAIHAARELGMRFAANIPPAVMEHRDRVLIEQYRPEWSDQAKRDADYTAMSEYAIKRGAKPYQVASMRDPWMVEMLHKAFLYDAGEAARTQATKAVVTKPPVIKAGTKVSAGAAAQSQVQGMTAKLKSSGTLADAVALLQAKRAAR